MVPADIKAASQIAIAVPDAENAHPAFILKKKMTAAELRARQTCNDRKAQEGICRSCSKPVASNSAYFCTDHLQKRARYIYNYRRRKGLIRGSESATRPAPDRIADTIQTRHRGPRQRELTFTHVQQGSFDMWRVTDGSECMWGMTRDEAKERFERRFGTVISQ